MTNQHYVVIGSGPAGSQAAFTLRHHDPEAQITVISKYRESGYCAHKLPNFIAGGITREQLASCSLQMYDEHNIKLRNGQEVVACNALQKTITLSHREVISFDGLIIAVGGKPLIPERLQSVQDLMYTLKTVEDARRWSKKLKQAGSVLIIGGDLTSFSVANVLLKMNKKVLFILDDGAFWPMRADDSLFQAASEKLQHNGVEVLPKSKVNGIRALPDGQCQVSLDNHATVDVGMVGAFFGLVPDIRFLASSGLAIDRGILVDEFLCSDFSGIYATGDCAQIYHPAINDYWISIGYTNAEKLGRQAAQNLLGHVKKSVEPESVFDLAGVSVNTSWWLEY